MEDHGIEFCHIGATRDQKNENITYGGRLTEENVISSLEILLDPNSYPCK